MATQLGVWVGAACAVMSRKYGDLYERCERETWQSPSLSLSGPLDLLIHEFRILPLRVVCCRLQFLSNRSYIPRRRPIKPHVRLKELQNYENY